MTRLVVEAVGKLRTVDAANFELKGDAYRRLALEAQKLEHGRRRECDDRIRYCTRHQDGAGNRCAGNPIRLPLDLPVAGRNRIRARNEWIVRRASAECQHHDRRPKNARPAPTHAKNLPATARLHISLSTRNSPPLQPMKGTYRQGRQGFSSASIFIRIPSSFLSRS